MTDHQHFAEGYGDASVPCSTKTGAIPARDDDTWISPDTDEIDAMTCWEVAVLVIFAVLLVGVIPLVVLGAV